MNIKEAIDNGIVREAQKDVRERYYLYASDVLQCQRKILLEFNKLRAMFDARTYRKFDMGNSVHTRIVKYLKQAGIPVESEIDIPKNEHNIHGRLDARIIEDGEPKLVEIKSMSMDKRYYNRYLTEPKKEHIAQLHVYMKYTGILKGYILYEIKQNQDIFLFDVVFDAKLWEETEKWIKDTNELLRTNTIPSIPFIYKRDVYPCQECKFRIHCWGEISPGGDKVESENKRQDSEELHRSNQSPVRGSTDKSDDEFA